VLQLELRGKSSSSSSNFQKSKEPKNVTIEINSYKEYKSQREKERDYFGIYPS